MASTAANAADPARLSAPHRLGEREPHHRDAEHRGAHLEWSIAELGALARYVDSLSASSDLRRHPALCAQLRRAALEALAYASNASEEPHPHHRRVQSLRALGAMYELEVIGRIARHTSALCGSEGDCLSAMCHRATGHLRACIGPAGHHVW